MEPDDRLQHLENVVRELQTTAALALRLQLITYEALADVSPAMLAVVHERIGSLVNAARMAGPDPNAPVSQELVTGLESVRSTIGVMLRQ